MQYKNEKIFFSPSDLITFLESPFASHMDRSLLEDRNKAELLDPEDPMLVNLRQRGFEHESSFLADLVSEGKNIIEIKNDTTEQMLSKTMAAMADGVEVIAQAYLQKDNFAGIADFLIKVHGESDFGDFHYEVWDTKLSKKTKPYFAIQLCSYAEMLENIQGIRPEKLAVVLGDKKIIELRTLDYYAYFNSSL